MKRISGMFKSIYLTIGRQGYSPGEYKWLPYLVEQVVDDGVLLCNMFTREIILLTEAEYAHPEADLRRILAEHWYMIPAGLDPRSLCYLFKHSHNARFGNRSDKTQLCTILTTTECNAHCPYCYEAGCEKRTMTDQVAGDVADWIEKHCDPDKVHLKWFGGEPLCNAHAVTVICQHLQKKGINYDSSMVSNGYLLDQHDRTELLDLWRLNRVQITLDGTEDTYNRIKRISGARGAYRRVLDNIRYVLDLGIRVNIRLNLSLENYNDLTELIGILRAEFGGYRNIFDVYAKPLFEGDDYQLTGQERAQVYGQYIDLEMRLCDAGLRDTLGMPKVKHRQCMADNGHSVVILPGGELGLCEHHLDDEYVGTIYNDARDGAIVEAWKEHADELPECAACFYYPVCLQLKKCPGKTICNAAHRGYLKWRIQESMAAAYKKEQEAERKADV
ncbi:MAG: radical SAM protein [Lachnospiraceae bacterium]|nr:radical SAM protein [Lachnospiraceae bacterium]